MDLSWPELELHLSAHQLATRPAALAPAFRELLTARNLPPDLAAELPRLYLPLAAWLAQRVGWAGPLLVGINGAQGSGKSTLCALLAELLAQGFGLRCCVLSIDDLYLTREKRRRLSQQIHPLLATRGVPGTHDVGLGLQLFERLRSAAADSCTPLPRFDKATDERVSEPSFDNFRGRPDLILFEGWCVGAVAQERSDLIEAVNLLEETEDLDGVWRNYVNQCLKEDYPQLFEQLDLLLMLKIPCWEMVGRWRGRQEAQLAATRRGSGVMDEAGLRRFIMHYERLTRYQLSEMPQRADLVLELNDAQRVLRVKKKAATA